MSDYEDRRKEDAARLRSCGEDYMSALLASATVMRDAFAHGEAALSAYIAAMELAAASDLPWDPYEAGERIDLMRASMRDVVVRVLSILPDEPQFSYAGQDVRH